MMEWLLTSHSGLGAQAITLIHAKDMKCLKCAYSQGVDSDMKNVENPRICQDAHRYNTKDAYLEEKEKGNMRAQRQGDFVLLNGCGKLYKESDISPKIDY